MTKKTDRKKKIEIVDEDSLVDDGDAMGAPQEADEDSLMDQPAPAEAEIGEESAAQAALQAKTVEYEELLDRHLRLVAEFDNYRKRTNREMGEMAVRSQAQLLTRLLDALDDLGRVADLDPDTSSVSDIVSGIDLVERKFFKELEAMGLEPIGEVGESFDPNHHEAIGTVALENEEDDNKVAAVLQIGYRVGTVLLRPARVQVYM